MADCKEFAFGGRLLKQPLGRTGLPVEALAKTGGRVKEVGFVMGEEGMGYIGWDGRFILRGDWQWASPVEIGTMLVEEKDTGKPLYIRMLYEED